MIKMEIRVQRLGEKIQLIISVDDNSVLVAIIMKVVRIKCGIMST